MGGIRFMWTGSNDRLLWFDSVTPVEDPCESLDCELLFHEKEAMVEGARLLCESGGPVLKLLIPGTLGNNEGADSRRSFKSHWALRESTELRRSSRLSCAMRCVSIVDPRRFGAGASTSISMLLGTPGPTNWGSMSSPRGPKPPRSIDILRFVPCSVDERLGRVMGF